METALVTGAAGFIGSHLVEGLLDRGYQVRGLDNLSTGGRGNLETVRDDERFMLVEADVCDAEAVTSGVADVDCVFHLAAHTSVPESVAEPAETTAVNCTGTATVLEAAREHDARVVFASSAAVYGSSAPVPATEDAPQSPTSPYALSKQYGEQLARQLDLSAVALRYFNVYGPGQDADGPYAAVIPAFIERMRAGERPIIYGDGKQTRDFVFVEDLVSATVRAARREPPDTVYNVGSGEGVSILELVDALNDVLGTDLEPVHEERRPGDIRHSRADISRARADLGYTPDVSLREGLAETVSGI